jgi:hypothetical protein
MGQTVTQMPHPMQDEFALLSCSCFKANCMTSMPTWQYREHSPHAMQRSFEWMAKRLALIRVNALLKISIIFASGHQ